MPGKLEKIRKILFTPKKIATLHILGGLIFIIGFIGFGIAGEEMVESEYFSFTIYRNLIAMKNDPLLKGTELEKVIGDLERMIKLGMVKKMTLETTLKELYLALIFSRFFPFAVMLFGLFLVQKGREILKEVSIKGKLIYFTSFLSLLAFVAGLFAFWSLCYIWIFE